MTTGTVNFGGLISGLDTNNIIEQLVSLKETQLLDPPTAEILENEDKEAALSEIATVYNKLRTSSNTLIDGTAATFNSKTASSSDTSEVLVTAVNSATAVKGTYQISNISKLAQPDRIIFDGEADKDSTLHGAQTITITYNSVETTINITAANSTLQGIANTINDANVGITASIINDGDTSVPVEPYRLILTSNSTGADFSIGQNIDTLYANLSVDNAASTSAENTAQDAEFQINGVSIKSSNNTTSEAITGVTFSLLDTETTNTITLTVKQDSETIAEKISTFVSDYQVLYDGLVEALKRDEATGAYTPLGKDTTLQNSQVRINNIITTSFTSMTGYAYDRLQDIGITTDVNGRYIIDSSKLNSALDNNIEDVKLLFQGNTQEDGVAEKMYDHINSLTQTGGIFDDKIQSYRNQIEQFEEIVIYRSTIIEEYRERLQRQFGNLEQQLAQLNLRQSQIDSFSAIYSNSANQLL